MAMQHGHDRSEALVEGRVDRIGGELVILDEVDAAGQQLVHQRRGLLGAEPDAGLDDGADERAAMHARLGASTCDTEARAGEALCVRLG